MSEYDVLDGLDAALGGPFRFRHRGQTYTVKPPADLSWQQVLYTLSEEHIPGCPADMPLFKADELFRAWAAHYALPTFNEARRLVYNVNRYRRSLENDLRVHARVELGELWRERDWDTLLNAIDHLPSYSHYGEAVAADPEHAKMLMQAIMEREQNAPAGASEDSAPPLHTWDPTVNMLANVVDAVRGVQYAVIASNHNKGPMPKPPDPMPRPKSVLDRARKQGEYQRKLSKHQSLTARMLPQKQPGYVPPSTPEPEPSGPARGPDGRFIRRK